MPELPTLGAPQKSSTLVPVAVAATVVGLLAGGFYWVTHRGAESVENPPPVATSLDAATGDGGSALQALPNPSALAVAPGAVAPAPESGIKVLATSINGPLESAVVQAAGKEVGAPLTQVINRSLVWWLRVPQDLMRGDALAVVYETRDGQEPLVHGVRFTSRKFGKTFEAWRYQPKGAPFPRFFQADGSELEERLVGGPLDSWEQITSLLRDGRKHRGVDFKTPVGTPVKATFDGVITRKNWNFRANGNSLEIDEAGGQHRTAMFLHLAELPKTVQPGQRVKKGEVLAKSGNTGRSFAPHLHYQLLRGDKVIDPFTSHPTERASLPAADKPGFEAEVVRLRQLLPAEVLAGG
jgi:murein DD-endopeptidase